MDYLRYSTDFAGDMTEKILSARNQIEDLYGQHSICCYISPVTLKELGIKFGEKIDDIAIYQDNGSNYGEFLFW